MLSFSVFFTFLFPLEIKCVPFLDSITVVPKLECFQVASIMNTPIVTLPEKVQIEQGERGRERYESH